MNVIGADENDRTFLQVLDGVVHQVLGGSAVHEEKLKVVLAVTNPELSTIVDKTGVLV
jgi:hypothetical protein